MAEPFLSEVRIFSFNYAPRGWAFCNGQFLPINQNQALFSLLGTTFGGNGQTTFALPNFQGCVPIHVGAGHTLGEKAGSESVTLSIQQMTQHFHVMQASNTNANVLDPQNAVLGAVNNEYGAPANLTTLNPLSVTNTGGSQPHTNMQPYLALNFCIALQGIFPSPN
jgi:microcystin-dependent protein